MLMNHPIEQEELMAYLDGELASDGAAATATHLEGCQECQRLAADFHGLSQQLASWQVEQSGPALENNIAAALDKHLSQPRRKFAFLARRQTLAWAGGLGVVAFVGAVMIQTTYPQHQEKFSAVSALRAPGVFQIRDSNASASVERVLAKSPIIAHRIELAVVTKDFDGSRRELEEILKRHGGYMGDLAVNAQPGSGRYLEAILRVPTDQREAVMAELKALGRVESESQSGEDVTQQSVDLDARLSNAQNSEKRLTDLLRERTGKLTDVLAVEKEIERVRGEIERMESERKNLTNRVDFIALNVKLYEVYTAGIQMPGSLFFRLRNAAVEGYKTTVESVTSAVSFMLMYGPSVLFWSLALFFPVRFIWRRFPRRLLHSL
jgi:hypothetical protein